LYKKSGKLVFLGLDNAGNKKKAINKILHYGIMLKIGLLAVFKRENHASSHAQR
jgi:hypothetical protein